MQYYYVEFLSPDPKQGWCPIKEYREDLGVLVFNSQEKLTLEQAQDRLKELSIKHRWMNLRVTPIDF